MLDLKRIAKNIGLQDNPLEHTKGRFNKAYKRISACTP